MLYHIFQSSSYKGNGELHSEVNLSKDDFYEVLAEYFYDSLDSEIFDLQQDKNRKITLKELTELFNDQNIGHNEQEWYYTNNTGKLESITIDNIDKGLLLSMIWKYIDY